MVYCKNCGKTIDPGKDLCYDCQRFFQEQLALARPVRCTKPLIGTILSPFGCLFAWIAIETAIAYLTIFSFMLCNMALGCGIPSLVFGIQAIVRCCRYKRTHGRNSVLALVLGICATVFASIAILGALGFWVTLIF